MSASIDDAENKLSFDLIPKIRVVIRKRPLSKRELNKNEKDVIEIKDKMTVIVKEQRQKVDLTKYIEEHKFKFDLAYDQETENEKIYLEIVRPMIEAAFNGIKITCFAYGQTGSGKTYTMMGIKNKVPGLYLLAANDIFSLLNEYNNFCVFVSFYEIYCGKLFDLLDNKKILNVREDGKQNICIVGLTEKNVENLNDMMKIIEYGLSQRVVGVTGANTDSSRSHGIIQIIIKDKNNTQQGKISFIDLAGSERAIDTIDTNKQTKFDGAEINKSLLALKECIRALEQEKKHTPFRGSKLTLVLRDSFIGNCKTLMIGNISPSSSSSEHTLNTLRYADRVKELKIKNNNVSFAVNNKNKTLIQKDMQNNQNKKTRNNSKKIGHKSMKASEKNSINNMDELCEIKDKKNNKIKSEKNIINISSDINFFKNIPNIKVTRNSMITHNTKAEEKFITDNDVPKNDSLNLRNTCLRDLNCNLLKKKDNKDNNESLFVYSGNCDIKEEDNNNNEMSDKEEEKTVKKKGIKKTKSGYVGFNFLNNYKNFTEKMCEKNSNNLSNDEEIEELNKKLKILENNISNEQNKCLESHKIHIDSIVDLMKKEMNIIDIVENNIDIKKYVEQCMKIFNLEEIKIAKIKRKFKELNLLLKEKDNIEKKIKLLNNKEKKDESFNNLNNTNTNYNSSESDLSLINSQLLEIETN